MSNKLHILRKFVINILGYCCSLTSNYTIYINFKLNETVPLYSAQEDACLYFRGGMVGLELLRNTARLYVSRCWCGLCTHVYVDVCKCADPNLIFFMTPCLVPLR